MLFRKILASFLILMQSCGPELARADTKITQLPLGNASTSASTDVFPYVDITTGVTKKMRLGNLISLPSMQSTFISGVASISRGGTGQTNSTDAITALLPPQGSHADECLHTNGTLASWDTCGIGTVTSVALSLPSIFNVSGSPITSTGTITASLASQTANTAFIAPNGSDGAPTFRLLAAEDIPSLPASKIGSGFLSLARGGTGTSAVSAAAAFNALAPTTTIGDMIQLTGSGNVRLPGNTTTTKNFLTSTGTGSVANPAAWGTIANTDLSGITNTQLSGSAAISNANLASMATLTIKGNNTGGSAVPSDLTATQTTAMLNAMVGDSGSGGTKGLVPAPASGDAAAGKFLKADATWAAAGLNVTSQASPSPTPTQNLLVPNSQATITTTSTQLLETGNSNQLANANFEASTVTSGWTVANATPTPEPTNIQDGKKGLKLSLSSASGIVLSQSVTPTGQVVGQTWDYGMWVKTTLSTIQLCPLQGGSIAGPCANAPGDGSWHYLVSTLPAGSGTNGVALNVTSSSTGDVYTDNSYAGATRSIGTAAQATLVGTLSYPATASCSWDRTGGGSNTIGNFSADTDCGTPVVTGSITAPGTKIPGFVMTNAPPGNYLVLSGVAAFKSGTNDANATIRLSDGTNNGPESQIYYGTQQFLQIANTYSASFSYTGAQSSVTIQFQGKTTNTSNTVSVQATDQPLTFYVYRFPAASEVITNANLNALQPAGEMMAYAGSTCPIGWMAADGSAISRTTYVQMFNRIGTAFGAGDGSTTFNIPDGRNVFMRGANASTRTIGGIVYPAVTLGSTTGDIFQAHTHHMIIDFPSPGQSITNGGTSLGNGNKLMTSASAPNGTITYSEPDATSGGTPRYGSETRPVNLGVNYCIRSFDQSMIVPVLNGSVTSNSSGPERVERANVTISGGVTCTINSQSGTWVASTTINGTGDCTLNLTSGIFSSAPSCSGMALTAGDASTAAVKYVSKTTSAIRFNLNRILTSPGIIDNGTFDIICMGPR